MSTREKCARFACLRWHPYARTAVVVALGVAASVAVFWAARAWELRSIQRDFDDLADARFRAIGNVFEETVKFVEFVDNAFMVGPRADSPAFPDYLRSLKTLFEADRSRHPELRALTWVPRVSPGQRTAYEKAAQAAFDGSFRIGEPGASADAQPDAGRVDQFPVYVRVAAQPERTQAGKNLMLDPAARKAMQRARDSGRPIALAPMKISPDAGDRLGYRVFQPLHRGGDHGDTASRRQTLAGFLCLDLDVGALVDKALLDLAPVGIDLWVCDDTDGTHATVCRHTSHLHSTTAVAGGHDEPASLEELQTHWVREVFGRKLPIGCCSAEAFWIGRTIWQPWVLLGVGLALTFALAGHQLSLAFRERAIDRVVARRTASLREEMERWQQTQRSREEEPASV